MSVLAMTSPKLFSFTMTARQGPWNVGIPLGHPVRLALEEHRPNAEDLQGTAFLDCRIQASVEPGSGPGDSDVYGWLQRLIEGIQWGFDYGQAIKALPDHHTLRIEMMVREIRDRLLGQ